MLLAPNDYETWSDFAARLETRKEEIADWLVTLNGKLRLYAKRDATDQLRANKGISIQIVGRDLVGDVDLADALAA